MKKIKEFNLIKIKNLILLLFTRFKWEMIYLTFLTIIAGLLEAINLLVLYPVINSGLKQNSKGFIIDLFDQITRLFDPNNIFLFYCYFLIMISFISIGFRAFTYHYSYCILKKISSFYYKEVFTKYNTNDYQFFVKNQQGKLMHTGNAASQSASAMIIEFIRMLSFFFSFILLYISIFMISWKGTIIISIIGALYVFIIKYVNSGIIYPYGYNMVSEDRSRNVILNEFISGIKTIKIFLVNKVWLKNYYDTVDRQTSNEYCMLMGRVIPESLLKLSLFMLIAGSGIFIESLSNGNIVPLIPLFGTFALITTRIVPTVQSLGNSMMNLVTQSPNVEILFDLLNEKQQIVLEGKNSLKRFKNDISFNNVWFKFSDAKQYLFEGLNFEIEKKRTTALVGSSGNGKSTIINLLFRLYPIQKGKIFIDGIDISNYTFSSYLSKISYVSQETFIYNASIKENIRFGMGDYTDEEIIESAKLANAHKFIKETENGYDTIVGDAGVKISGGQRQRIAIARAMLKKPEILVLDEATSSLDNISENRVQNAINNLSKHTTILVIAHRLSTIINADKILVLSDGKIVEEGIHEDLLKIGGEYSNLYKMQFK